MCLGHPAALQKVREEAAALNGEFASSRRSRVQLPPFLPPPPTSSQV